MSVHEVHMQRAIELARLAEGCTSPNPLVGCVVVNNGVVVGSGWHSAAGEAHAEAVALQQAGEQSRGATLYVCLEPCSHHGRTPPCTDAIIKAGISTVVYAAADTNPRATGGASLLDQAGIKTVQGVLEQKALELNRFYFHHVATGLPYVVAKFAASLDGRIATRTLDSQWITGPAARQRSHQLRQAVDAIVVGAQTVIHDNPQLTVRQTQASASGVRHPLRIVLDSTGRVPLDARVFSPDLEGSTLLVTTPAASDQHRQQLELSGTDVLCVESSSAQQVHIPDMLVALGQRGVQSLMVEGGPAVLGSFFDHRMVNEVWAFLAPKLIGGEDAPAAIGGLGINQLNSAARLRSMQFEQLADDLLIRGQLEFGHAVAQQTEIPSTQLADNTG